jgi:probable F420-dependent oxidoreductase
MEFGVNVFLTDDGIHPVTAGQVAESAGLSSIFVGDHTHIPEATANGDALVAECYARFLDVFAALSAIAVTTTTLQLGTGVCLVPQREPLGLAKQVATLDQLSGGRVVFGVGAGWNTEETRNHGIDPDRRFGVMRERILAMQRLWSDDVAEFHGDHVDFTPALSWPKPVQRPHPPIVVGGRGKRVLERVLAYGDGWGPDVVGGLEAIRGVARQMEDFRGCQDACPRPLTATAMGVLVDEACVEAVLDLGFDRCLFSVPAGTADEIEENIGRAGELARRFA